MRVSDIIYETAKAWVYRDRANQCYTVFKIGVTHSTSDSAYAMTADGLTLATARCAHLTNMQGAK